QQDEVVVVLVQRAGQAVRRAVRPLLSARHADGGAGELDLLVDHVVEGSEQGVEALEVGLDGAEGGDDGLEGGEAVPLRLAANAVAAGLGRVDAYVRQVFEPRVRTPKALRVVPRPVEDDEVLGALFGRELREVSRALAGVEQGGTFRQLGPTRQRAVRVHGTVDAPAEPELDEARRADGVAALPRMLEHGEARPGLDAR